MGRVMAVDIGASSYRVIEGVYSGGCLSMKVLARFKHEPVMEDGHYRWDVYGITRNVTEVIREAAREGEPVVSIEFDTFGTDFGLLDRDGRLLEKPIAYRDSISNGICGKYFHDDSLYARIGGSFSGTCTASILKGMREIGHKPLDQAERLLFMPDLMAYLFTGGTVNEATIATTSRLMDIGKREWDYELIEDLGIPGKIFGPLSEAGSTVGRLKREISRGIGNLEDTTVVLAACHDTASAVSIIPRRRGCSFISSGTWSVKGIVCDTPYRSEQACRYQMANEGQPGGRYRLIRNITGLWLMEECVRSWKKEGVTAEIPEIAKQAAGKMAFPSIIDVDAPDFAEAGDMPEKIRKFCQRTGQKIPDTPVDVMQVIVQGLASEYRRHNEQIEEVTGEKIHTIYIVGGGRNNRYLNQCTADATGCRVIAGHPEATAMGNLLIQLWAAGEVASMEEIPAIAGKNVTEEIYVPKCNKEV
jgi:Sugar (pentulose and hexulose) kinases